MSDIPNDDKPGFVAEKPHEVRSEQAVASKGQAAACCSQLLIVCFQDPHPPQYAGSR